MKKHLIQTCAFLGLFILMCVGAYELSDSLVYAQRNAILTFDPEIQVVFAGDSHVQCGVNDKLVANSINVASSGEAYLFSYVKLKALLECNSQVKAVYLGYGMHNFEESKEKAWLYKDAVILDRYPLYSFLLGAQEKKLLFVHNPKAVLRAIRLAVIHNVRILAGSYSAKSPLTLNHLWDGGHWALVGNRVEKEKQSDLDKKEPFFTQESIQFKYLKLVADLCASKSVKLTLLSVPKHDYYFDGYDKSEESCWRNAGCSLRSVELMDFSHDVMPLSCYRDAAHLNKQGAELFSRHLERVISGATSCDH